MIERFDSVARTRVPSPAPVEKFLDAYEALCREHGMCLSHQDYHGAFIVEHYSRKRVEWVRAASMGVLRKSHRESPGE